MICGRFITWVACLTLAAHSWSSIGATVIKIGEPAAQSHVPRWDARDTGPLPWQGIACLDVSADGRAIAVGTIALPGNPNLFLLDEHGTIVSQHGAGHRWLNDVTVSDDARFVTALSTTPEGTAGDTPRFFAFSGDKEVSQISDRFRFRDFRPGGFMFHYGDHSNHLPRLAHWTGGRWVVAGDDIIYWLSPQEATPVYQAHLGPGVTTAFAASPSGLAVVGRYGGTDQSPDKFPNLLIVRADQPKPIVWSRPVTPDVAPAPKPEKGSYGLPAPPYDDVKFSAPLSVAIDGAGQQIAVADYAGWQRVFHPRDGRADITFGTRFMPARPTIHIYDAAGNLIRRVGPESFPEAFWCDLKFTGDGGRLLISPHNWTSRGLGGQPFLPADERACTLYVLDIASGKLDAIRFPDAISSVDSGTDGQIAVGCWDLNVYLLDKSYRSKQVAIGAASLVRFAQAGKRVVVADASGTVRLLNDGGTELWRTDLNKTAQPGDKPWTKNQKADQMAPGIWRTNGGLAHSDLGSQILIEAPRGLILIDPNAGASFEQNWARIAGAGFDPRQLKYVLLTHEHGDHAPGAYLWRVITGAQVVASAEMAYILQHHIPGGTGYGFHPPVPVDITMSGDKELDLAGLKVRAIRLPGHTAGSLGYVFEKDGRKYVATGDLIMPGGVLGYSGSLDFSAEAVLRSLKKLAALRPDVVLGGHGSGDPEEFIAKGIEAGEATGWSKMTPPKPNPFCRFAQTNYLVVAWRERILSAAYGDVDGDGRPDVAVLIPKGKGSAVKIYLNDGSKFGKIPDAEIDLPELSHGWKLRLLPPGPGKFANFFASSESQAFLLLAQQDQLKFKAVPVPVTRGSEVAVGDFTASGRRDLLIGSRFVSGFSIASQSADGTFQVRPSKTQISGYMNIAVVDINGDKRDDLVTSGGAIFVRQPDGTLADAPTYHLTPPAGEPAGWAFVAASDFDRDGWTDVALLANGNAGATVWLYRNTRDAQMPFRKEPDARFVVADADVNRDGPTVADWNGDGIPDVILCKRGEPPGVRVLTGSPTDGINPERVVSINLDYTPHFDTRFGVADFDGDGRADLAGFGPSSVGATGVYIWLQPRQ